MTPDPWCTAARHGTRTAYGSGCRCDAARRAISRANAQALLRREALGPAYVDSTGTRRRIRALVANGWTYHELSARTFWPVSMLGTLGTNPRPVSRETARRIAALYDDLEYVQGPSRLAAVRARRKGWAIPDQWTTDIDDPDSQPAALDAKPNYHAKAAPIEDVEILAANGETWERACARLDYNKRALDKRLRRAGRLDLIHRFTRNSEMYHAHEPNRNQWSA